MKMLLPVEHDYIPWLLLVGEVLHHTLGCGKKNNTSGFTKSIFGASPKWCRKNESSINRIFENTTGLVATCEALGSTRSSAAGYGSPNGVGENGPPNLGSSQHGCFTNKISGFFALQTKIDPTEKAGD